MPPRFFAILLAALFALPSSVLADARGRMTGAELRELWKSSVRHLEGTAKPGDVFKAGTFLGYVAATAEALAAQHGDGCLKGKGDMQRMEVVGRFLSGHPELGDEAARSVVEKALSDGFGCGWR